MSELESENAETLWLMYRRPRMPRAVSHVIVGAVYHPPGADDRAISSHILDSLDIVTGDHPYVSALLAGDFNQLQDASLLSYPLKQVDKSPTRGSAVLGKIYTNLQDWYEKPVILPNIARSDHKAVLMTPTIVTKAEGRILR